MFYIDFMDNEEDGEVGNVQKHETILLKELNARKVLSLDSAMQLLHVSESTVRRLFASMEDKGICVRNSGSIKLLNNDFTNIYVYEHMESTNVLEKAIIAEKALSYIKSGDILFLDAGTTLARLSMAIMQAIQEKRLSNITIFTNSLINFNLLKGHCVVNLMGGEYRENRKDFHGALVDMVIKNVCFSKCFIGTDGYSKGKGFIAADFISARILKSVIESSQLCYILADTNKFGKTSGMRFAENEDVTAVITNDPNGLEDISKKGLTIL